MSTIGTAENRASSDAEPEGGAWPEALAEAFRRLDVRLRQAIGAADPDGAGEAEAQPYRGLYIAPGDVVSCLDREPGALRLGPARAGEAAAPLGSFEPWPRLVRVGRAFGLTRFDLAVVLIALAPEFDLKYERVYAYLQDDVSRRRPSVDLALDLLCPSAAEKLARRDRFAPDAPLVLSRVLRLSTDHHAHPPLPAWTIRLDEQIVRYLLHQRGLDPRLSPACRLIGPARGAAPPVTSLSEKTWRWLASSVVRARKERLPLWLYFQGRTGSGQAEVAAALATEAGAALLAVDLARWPGLVGPDLGDAVNVLMREAMFQGALLYLEPWDALADAPAGSGPPRDALPAELAAYHGVGILSGERPWEPLPRGPHGVVSVRFDVPAYEVRRGCWRARADAAGLPLGDAELDALANLYRLNPGQIADAVATVAATHPVDRYAEPTAVPAAAFFAAARAQSGHALARLARRVEPAHGWDDLVLATDSLRQLREICRRIRFRRQVLEDWGFGRKIARNRGTSALFSGPSGTGKTTAASIIAGELRLELYEIDLSRVVSKYIGETEQNLRKIFEAAVDSNAILLFNEADALWGRRSEVRDAHDRYANIEIAFLLQEMEQFDGVAVLTTNLRQHIDEAFTRRLDFLVDFPFPDEEARRRIWDVLLPPEAPREQVDLDLLARLRLTGGNIKNVVYAGAYLAAAEGRPIGTTHLVQAVRREYQKLGRILNESELGPYADKTR